MQKLIRKTCEIAAEALGAEQAGRMRTIDRGGERCDFLLEYRE